MSPVEIGSVAWIANRREQDVCDDRQPFVDAHRHGVVPAEPLAIFNWSCDFCN